MFPPNMVSTLRLLALPWLLFCFLLGANVFFLHSSVLGSLLVIVFLGFGGWISSNLDPSPTLSTVALGTLGWIATITAVSGALYRLTALTLAVKLGIIVLLPIASILAVMFVFQRPALFRASLTFPLKKVSIPRDPALILFTLALFSAALAYRELFTHATVEAIRSPWHLLGTSFFVPAFVAHLLAALAFTLPARRPNLAPLTLVVLLGLHLTVALILYRVGYGFDQFIHQATEQLILANGSVSPKPWYYLGQYGLNTILATIAQFDIGLIDRALLPMLATATLPVIVLYSLRQKTKDERAVFLTTLFMLVFPLTMFIQTTPQGLGNLMFLAVVFLTSAKLDVTRHYLLLPLVAAALVLHPVAGIPALIIFLLYWLYQRTNKISHIFLAALFAVPILPGLFWIFERVRGATPTVTQFPLSPLTSTPLFYVEQRFQLLLDGVYTYGFNGAIIFSLVALTAIIILWRKKYLADFSPLLATAAVLCLDGYILSQSSFFSYLISYEQSIFATRFFELAAVALLPLIAVLGLHFFQRLLKTSSATVFFIMLSLVTTSTIALYLTYPRFDGYAFDRGYSTSEHDINAVEFIESHAQEPYAVLANQAVSAAALKAIGFKQYFTRLDEPTGEAIFFYPIPTGGTLYQIYLEMVYENPARETAHKAMAATGVNRVYFMLNDYWTDFETLVPEAKASADQWWSIDNGKIYVFEYRR